MCGVLRSTRSSLREYYSLVSFQFPFLSLLPMSTPLQATSKVGGCVAMTVFCLLWQWKSIIQEDYRYSNKKQNDALVVHFWAQN